MPDLTPIADPAACVTGPHVRFTILTERLLRLEYSPTDQYEDRPSQAFWYRQQPVPQFSSKITDKTVEVETEFLKLEYRLGQGGFRRSTLSIHLKQSGKTWRYGMRSKGNLGGTARTLDSIAGKTRLEPGLVSRSGWAVVDDTNSLIFDPSGWLTRRSTSGNIDLYFFGFGNEFAECLRDFTKIAGPIPLIPRYLLGNWWSRYWTYTQAELQTLVENFRKNDVPLSVCMVDMDWHVTKTGNEASGWTGYTWNRDLFPDPPGFVNWLHKQGLKTALNLHPAEGIYPHEEQFAEMAFFMGLDPAVQKPIPFNVTGRRFMEGYFNILLHPLEKMGIDFWWLDWQQGSKSQMPGLDPLWALNHLHFQDLGRDGHKRPFVLSRWGGLGNHRYPIGFSGDTIIRWKSLSFQPRFTATAANVGFGWWSHDIGGHMWKEGSPELYVRWVQFGLFSPILRLHSSNMPELDRRPWSKPERYFQAAREALQLRHAFIPYLYSMAWRAHQTGLALVLPMYYGDVSKAAFACPDQYFFGTELIAAPVVKPARSRKGSIRQRVWLPKEAWFNFFSGKEFRGGRWHTIRATLEDIPVFAKAGAIVPLGPKTGWGGVGNPKTLDIYLFPGTSNRFELYEDDGETTGYQNGEYALTVFTLEKTGSVLTFKIEPVSGEHSLIPAKRQYRLHLRGVDASVTCDHPSTYDPDTRTLDLEPVEQTPDAGLSVIFQNCS
jgi:alpha-glucosidase (family GH31 glycosyl hydrolase)